MTFAFPKFRDKSGFPDNRELQFIRPITFEAIKLPFLTILAQYEHDMIKEKADRSSMASRHSSTSKYISLFECLTLGLRQGIGAVRG